MQLVIKDDKLQRYRDHVQLGIELKAKEKEMFDRFFYAFSQLLDGSSERQVVTQLMKLPKPLGGVSQSQAYNIINGAQELFGELDMSQTKKKAQRLIYATRLEEEAAKIFQMADQIMDKYMNDRPEPFVQFVFAEKEAALLREKGAKLLEKAAKMRGLNEKDAVVNPNKFKVAPNIVFTDDLGALELQRELEDGVVEDVDFTEIDDAEGDGGEA